MVTNSINTSIDNTTVQHVEIDMNIDINDQPRDTDDAERDDVDENNMSSNNNHPLTLPSPIDKRKIFSLTSVSPFVRIAKKSEEKTKQREVETPETTASVIDVNAMLSSDNNNCSNSKVPPQPKPYVLPKGIPELPKDNLKDWFRMLEQAKRERNEALEILETMKEALKQAKESRDEANVQLENSTKTNSDLLNHITHLETQFNDNKVSYEKQLDELRIMLENNKVHSNNTIEKWKKKYNSQSNAWTDKFELLKQRLEEQKKKTSNAIQLVKETKEATASKTEQIRTDLEIVANKKCLKYEEENEKLLKEMNKLTDTNAIQAAYETTKRLKKEIESQNIKINNLNETNQELREKNEELNSLNLSTTKEVETLKNFMRKRVNEANKAKDVVSDLLRNARYERARVEKQNETLTSKMKIANEEMISYRKEINDKTRTIKRYDQSTNTLRREKDELKKQILLLNENKIKGDGEKDKIIQENFEKTTTIQELQSVKKQLQEDVVKIQKELKDTLKILKQTKARVKQLESELRHEKANFKEQNENYRDVSRQCKGFQQALNAKHKTVMRLSQSNQRNQQLKDELNQTQSLLHNAEGAAKEARQWGERALVQAKKSFSRKLIEEMSVLRSGHEQANKEVDMKNNEIIKLQAEIKQLMQEKDQSREDFMKFQQQHFYKNDETNGKRSEKNVLNAATRTRQQRQGRDGHHRDENYRHAVGNGNMAYKTREEIELDADIDEVDRMMEKERIMVERVMNNDRSTKHYNHDHTNENSVQHDNKNYHHIGQKKAAPSTTRTQNAHKRPPLLPQNVNTQHKDSRKKTSRSKYNKKANMNNNEETTSNDDDGDASSSSTGAQDVILEATKFIRRRQQARRRAMN
eukprot:g4890.t1